MVARTSWETELYPLDLSVVVDGQVSDSAQIRFGIGEVTAKLDEKNHRVFQINGKNILIRGAGYSFDMLLRSSPEKQQAELNYVRDLNHRLTPEQLGIHVERNTIVAKWLEHRLGWRRLLRACVGQEMHDWNGDGAYASADLHLLQ